jgi:ABC-type glycerol-3-phosphate transport system substrate-binding protein
MDGRRAYVLEGRVLPRRTLLARIGALATGIAATSAGGCRGRHASGRSSTPGATSVGHPGFSSPGAPIDLVVQAPFSDAPDLLAQFNATQQGIRAMPWSRVVPILLSEVVQGAQFQQQQAPNMIPLTTALRDLNFDVKTLLPGGIDAFTVSGTLAALPTTLRPYCVAWRPDAFEAAGLQPPSVGWTLAEFEAACAALQQTIAAARVEGLVSVLGPMVGTEYTVTDTSTRGTEIISGSLSEPGLWVAFALGFGGTVVAKNAFVVTDPGTVTGLSALVHLAAQYGMAPKLIPAQVDGIANFVNLYAMDFVSWDPGVTPLYGTKWRFARLPVFPVTPVIPTVFVGSGLSAPAGYPASAVSPYETAAARFLEWSYGSEAQALLGAAGVLPVISDVTVQESFWNHAPAEMQGIGDWRHFIDYADGWPGYPPIAIVANALAQAVQDPSTIGTILSSLQAALNKSTTSTASHLG